MINELRDLLATLTDDPRMRQLPADEPLLGGEAGLDSFNGVRLLRAIEEQYGVDIAAEDLNLDALTSLTALSAFVVAHSPVLERMRRDEAASAKVLFLVDAKYDASMPSGVPLADIAALKVIARTAVHTHGGNVLDESHAVFPNTAVTLVMVLAESHLSIHTWPEENRVSIDLFSCGSIDGRSVVNDLCRALGIPGATIQEIDRT